jgi:phage shock protein A
MAYDARQARQELLDTIAQATDDLGRALAALGAAYEQLDENSADRLEEQLFRPLQVAYGRARRTHAGFAERQQLPERAFEPAAAGAPSQGVKGFLDAALEAIADADVALADLQDSMMPVEVGDPQLRAGLAEVRERIGELPVRGREFLRTFGR